MSITNSKPDADVHIIFSCDQRLCKKLTNLVDAHIEQSRFNQKSSVILFGKRSSKQIEKKYPHARIYHSINGMADCKAIALTLLKNMPNLFIHYYSSEENAYIEEQVWPIKMKSNQSNIVNYDLLTVMHLYISSQLYLAYLETGLKEATERSLATSEAAENAEKSARELRKLYNKIRQAKITQEVTSGG